MQIGYRTNSSWVLRMGRDTFDGNYTKNGKSESERIIVGKPPSSQQVLVDLGDGYQSLANMQHTAASLYQVG